MKLSNILHRNEVIDIYGSWSLELEDITFDSRKASPTTLFFAICGTQNDGHDFINSAIEAGSQIIVCEKLPNEREETVTYVVVECSSKALALAASRLYHEPSKEISLVGITGTNGKTTTATLLYELFRKLGYKCGLISTVKYCIDDKILPSTHTTPDSIRINAMLREMVDAGCSYCFMEVSSHSIVQHRVSALHFTGGVFSNITHDHLDYHKTFKDYIEAKQSFFTMLPKKSFALYNADDRNGEVMVQNSNAKKYPYSIRGLAPYKCRVVETLPGGMLININSTELWVQFMGEFNAYNLLTIYATSLLLGQPKEEVLRAISELRSVEGRFDYIVSKDGITAIIDYAHTPDALERVLETIAEIKEPNKQTITVVGCGGDRDKTKRPEMARIALQNSDFTIFTSDNPRSERPEDILKDMTDGLAELTIPTKGKYVVIQDRAEAIKMASFMAKGADKEGLQGDIILIAGKGHENYQEIDGVKYHFDDKEQIGEHLTLE